MGSAAEVEHRSRAFEPDGLVDAARLDFAVGVVAQVQRFYAAVGLDALFGVAHVHIGVRKQDIVDESADFGALFAGKLGYRQAAECVFGARDLDLGLDRRLFEQSSVLLLRREALEQSMRAFELVRVEIAGQTGAFIAALVAVDQGAAEGDAFATRAAQTQVEVGAREKNLPIFVVGASAEEQAHQLHPGPVDEELIRDDFTTALGEPGVKQVRQELPLRPREDEAIDIDAATCDSAVVVLPQRVVVVDAGLVSDAIAEGAEESLSEFYGRGKSAAWAWREKHVASRGPRTQGGAQGHAPSYPLA